ncbi:MAG: acyl-CoA dehydrogenase family protein [Hyphomonadaceae bacterium]
MNFDDTPEEAAFRAEARAWLDANAPRRLDPILSKASFGIGLENVEGFDWVGESRAWQRKKFESGWACLHWPKEYGGRAASAIERVIWQQEEGIYALLNGPFSIAHGMAGTTMMEHATEAMKERYLAPMVRGEEIWCQLFSEPSGGSDLAGLRTKAERDGGDWIINGQKIWTSGAHFSDYGILLTRTDPSVPKHKGLTMFVLNMRAPGVEVRPIKQANGNSGFNEVYFTNVRIADDQRIGAVNNGWNVAVTTLMNERLLIAAGMPTGFAEIFEFCNRLETAEGPAINDRAVRAKLATWAAATSGLKYSVFRTISALSRGATPGPENSIGKLVAGSMMQDIAFFAADLEGQSGALNDAAVSAFGARFQAMMLRTPGMRIEGGSDQILRNIISERILGLPGDVRVDKDVPFTQVPTGAN